MNEQRWDSIIDEIVEKFSGSNLLKCGSRKEQTQEVKSILATLGSEKGYKVYCHGLQEEIANKLCCVNVEWMNDVIWYKDSTQNYMMDSLVLAAESEWDGMRKPVGNQQKDEDKYGSVKYDFQKLIVMKAQIKVMVFKMRNHDDLGELIRDYFQKAIDGFDAVDDAKYLIVAIMSNGEIVMRRICKKRCFSGMDPKAETMTV